MISDAYRALNAQLHRQDPKYGTGGGKWVPVVAELAKQHGAGSVLDYGCGKGDFGKVARRKKIGLEVREYDPAICGKDAMPAPADIVLCADVLEHVELEYVADVIDHICTLAQKLALVSVCIIEGSRRLPDGRPAHITVRGEEFWALQLEAAAMRHGFAVHRFSCTRDDTRTWLLTREEASSGN